MNSWIIPLIMLIIGSISGELRAELIDSVNRMAAKAKETQNPWDDILVGALKQLLNIP